ncbi:MAG: MBOAT family protein [Nanoarchaeota archaeon]|nr:MBOAT family protein [Nanoarchaeota archaeon]
MLFNSLHFLIFFPIVVMTYFGVRQKYRWIILLISSYYFYMSWKAEFIILIVFSTLINYLIGIKIYESKAKAKKRFFLWSGIIINLGLLFFFKYLNFFSIEFNSLMQLIGIQLNPLTLNIILPLGISFYTFQSLSYIIEIYWNKLKPEKHLGIFAVYISFFPQLVAGPIERAGHLLPQFIKKHEFEYKRATYGLKMMLWGFFKKVVIAERLAVVVNTIYNDATGYTGIPLIMATVFFAFQLYCDFSGYSDIAIGAAQVMGFRLMENFRRPYFSRSVQEFWKRWHISLSSWFKDYLYIPLGGNRVPIARWLFNIMVVFILSGFWHGANWTFVIWGALHGLFLIMEAAVNPVKKKILDLTQLVKANWLVQSIEIVVTFALVNIGWIFFRANTLSDAWYILTHLFQGINFNFSEIIIGVGWYEMKIAFGLIAFMECVHIMQEHMDIWDFLDKRPLILRWAVYIALILGILYLGQSSGKFIYFQF